MRRFRDLAPVPGPPRHGWLIGILVRSPGEAAPTRQFYAVGMADRARAEWAAADRAITIGDIASSPHKGMEPVEALQALSTHAFDWSGLGEGEVRSLGTKSPRRWLAG